MDKLNVLKWYQLKFIPAAKEANQESNTYLYMKDHTVLCVSMEGLLLTCVDQKGWIQCARPVKPIIYFKFNRT